MRLTLEQLKAMSDEELHSLWSEAKFPFDAAEACQHCLTTHAELRFDEAHRCQEPEHEELIHQAAALRDPNSAYDGPDLNHLSVHLEELYALRLFYDSLYPQIAEAQAEPLPQAEPVAVRA